MRVGTASSHAVAGSAGRFRGCEPYLTRRTVRGVHGRSCSVAAWRAAAIKSPTCHAAAAALRGKVAASVAAVPRLSRGCEPYLTRKTVRGAHGRSFSAAAWRAAAIKSPTCHASTLWRGSSISTLLTAPSTSFDAESRRAPIAHVARTTPLHLQLFLTRVKVLPAISRRLSQGGITGPLLRPLIPPCMKSRSGRI